MSSQLASKYDIIINGGGIVGFTLLNLLTKSPFLRNAKILLIEQSKKPANLQQWPRIKTQSSTNDCGEDISSELGIAQFSNRVSSINPSSMDIFRKLGVINNLKKYLKEVRAIRVWGYDYTRKIDFEPLTDCEDVMFSVVENNRLSRALLENYQNSLESHTASIAWNHTLEGLLRSPTGLIDVTISSGEAESSLISKVSAPLVIGCDGFKSKVRELSRLRYREMSLGKTAVVGTITVELPFENETNDIAYQRFSPEKDTVTALLPLDNKHSSFVISAPNEYAKHLVNCDEVTFISELNGLITTEESAHNPILKSYLNLSNCTFKTLHNIMRMPLVNKSAGGEIATDDGPRARTLQGNSRASFPLGLGTTSPHMLTPIPGVVVLGDASHRVPPLSGQGLNLGVQDAAELVRQLDAEAKVGEKLFDATDDASLRRCLSKFQCNRQSHTMKMIFGIMASPLLFKLAPQEYVGAFNKCTPMKEMLVKFANGPKLM